MALIFTPLDTGRYVARGRLVLRTLEGTDLNSLDILVRESIQNSLDAATNKAHPVTVDFSIIERPKEAICSIFDQTTDEQLNRKFKDSPSCNVLTIRDTGTTGLTGDFEDDNSKIYKLIADIGRAQENAGAGGSWGLGKTIYYHMGTNIVGFYSQTRDSKNNVRSRLSFGYIEDERKDTRLIPSTPSGIAWWGNEHGAPIHTKASILPILKKLGVPPFKADETGTCIIVPFFSQAESLVNIGEKAKTLPWENNEADYIKLSIQRWYANRLIKTKGKSTLKASVNGQRLTPSKIAPVFEVMQRLRKLTDNFKEHHGARDGLRLIHCTEEPLEWKIDKQQDSMPSAYLKALHFNQTFQDDERSRTPPVGWIAAQRLSERDLKMLPPNNLLSPHQYIFGSSTDCDEQLPIVAMSRSPQMIVAYNTSDWRSGLKLETEGEYLIVLFVLNSKARLLDGTKLEEYIRSIENPTHSDWKDSILKSKHKGIPVKIRNGVVRALRNSFFNSTSAIEDEPRAASIRAQLGQNLLPSDFGTAGTRPPAIKGKEKPSDPSPRQSQPSLSIQDDKTEYTHDEIKLYLTVSNAKHTRLKISIEADAGAGKTMTSNAWTDEIKSPGFPFELIKFELTGIRTLKNNGKAPAFRPLAPSDVKSSIDAASFLLTLKEGIYQQIEAELMLKTSDRSVNPVITLATAEA